VGEEGHRILPDVVAYAMVLELLTQEMRSDRKFSKALLWIGNREQHDGLLVLQEQQA
jgi:hypothetical protein